MNGEPPMPSIWRRVQVQGQVSLLKLHRILQAVMGWQDYHLHQFIVGGDTTSVGGIGWIVGTGTRYLMPDPDFGLQPGEKNERGVKLAQIAPGKGATFVYEYDFGDGWQHEIVVEELLPPEEGGYYPMCLEGAGACPPEDVGGIGGYTEFLEVIANPRHPEHKAMLRWAGGRFDPQSFGLNEVNQRLTRLR